MVRQSVFVLDALLISSGYTFLGQSRGEISPVFRETEYGSAGCYSGSVYDRHDFYLEGFWLASGRRSMVSRVDHQ
ncbi:hypothetical protein CK203_065957 [Vitis vinifera]|uniref:Uncharacterized protein n=1 Tax=Vitis vinifera TaxID=29760 RepID=A0A438FXF1_VITVI|nr:hypothetical protein CK203_065957 [Vitis vinifera]